MLTTVAICFIAYYGFLLFLMLHWLSVSNISHTHEKEFALDKKVSVIIPVRNESTNIAALLGDLSEQTFKNFEVIIVDDHSVDDTVVQIEKSMLPFVSPVKNLGEGKKQAITTGVHHAAGEIIVTTDGDCRVPAGWLESINHYFRDERISMVAGAVVIEANNTWERMQQTEFAFLIATGASSLSINWPTMCNGANLAYRKKVFFEVGGYDGNVQIASGDDEFLMRKMAAGNRKIVFNYDSPVRTAPQRTLQQFVHQRLRWAGKWRHNSDVRSQVLALFVFSFQIVFLIALAQTILVDGKYGVFVSFKIAIEALLIAYLGRKMNFIPGVISFLLLQVFYPFYVIYTGVASFIRTHKWKDRKYTYA